MTDPEREILQSASEIKQLLRDSGAKLADLATDWEKKHHFPLTGDAAPEDQALKFLGARTDLHGSLDKLRKSYVLADEAFRSVPKGL